MLAQPSQLALRRVQVATGRQQSRQQRVYGMRFAEECVRDPWHFEGGGRMLVLIVNFTSVERHNHDTPLQRHYTIACAGQLNAQPLIHDLFHLSFLPSIDELARRCLQACFPRR
jgi:hypothetical protein